MSEIKNLESRIKLTEKTLKVGQGRKFAAEYTGEIMKIYNDEFSAIKNRLAKCWHHPKKDTAMSNIERTLSRIECAIKPNNDPTPDNIDSHHFKLVPVA
ncbi:hypothetical protein L8P27_05165 [Enterobacter asburiae]|uniref:hypothetical protein n=1 Tax=Enterobacter asburiae TaxID=61645 RepID=UPI0020064E64|nr:hypothetical protein [Enterobacter asburiae]MCK7227242.1 hypothetical protein [Enterobacter asburiae]